MAPLTAQRIAAAGLIYDPLPTLDDRCVCSFCGRASLGATDLESSAGLVAVGSGVEAGPRARMRSLLDLCSDTDLDCWDPHDDPLAEHQRFAPECPFIVQVCSRAFPCDAVTTAAPPLGVIKADVTEVQDFFGTVSVWTGMGDMNSSLTLHHGLARAQGLGWQGWEQRSALASAGRLAPGLYDCF